MSFFEALCDPQIVASPWKILLGSSFCLLLQWRHFECRNDWIIDAIKFQELSTSHGHTTTHGYKAIIDWGIMSHDHLLFYIMYLLKVRWRWGQLLSVLQRKIATTGRWTHHSWRIMCDSSWKILFSHWWCWIAVRAVRKLYRARYLEKNIKTIKAKLLILVEQCEIPEGRLLGWGFSLGFMQGIGLLL